MIECTDLFTTFTLVRNPPVNVSIASGSTRGMPRGLEKVHERCQSSAAPVMSQALSARAHGGSHQGGHLKPATSTTSTRAVLSEMPHQKALRPFAHM